MIATTRRLWLVELIAWIILAYLAYLASADYWSQLWDWSFRPSSGPPAEERFRRGLEALIAIGLIASVPIVYRIVFVKLLLTEVLWPSFVAVVTDAINEGREEREREAREKREAVENATTLRHDDATKKILVDLVQSSKNQAQRILQRAGVYLIIGSLIAFFGVGFFYLETSPDTNIPDTEDWVLMLAAQVAQTAPRFGVLFFVEFVAFFFLRQYRTAMEEFRYFEAIQRRREELFALVTLMREEESRVNIERLIEADCWFSDSGRLAQGESTELLESKKLTKDEIHVLLKIIEAMSHAKGPHRKNSIKKPVIAR